MHWRRNKRLLFLIIPIIFAAVFPTQIILADTTVSCNNAKGTSWAVIAMIPITLFFGLFILLSSVNSGASQIINITISTVVSGVAVIVGILYLSALSGAIVCTDTTIPQVAGDPPAEPLGINATALSSTQIQLTWVPTANASGYKLNRESPFGAGFTTIQPNVGNVTTFTDTGLSAGTQYNYKLFALNQFGSATGDDYGGMTTTWNVPDPPTGLSARATSQTRIDLSWASPIFDGGTGVTGYKIERQNSCAGGYNTLIGNTGNTTTTFNNTGLTANTCYSYRVSSINSVGTGSSSTSASATTPAVPSVPPAPPTNVKSNTQSTSSIKITWTAPSGPITGYKVEEETPVGNGFGTINANTGNTTTSYTVISLTSGTQYNFRISGINGTGTGSPSGGSSNYTINLAPSGLILTPQSISKIHLSWVAPSGTLTGYKINRNGSTIVANTGNTTTHYDNTGLTQGTGYSYTIQAINQGGTSSASTSIAARTWDVPSAPLNLGATAITTTRIDLSWSTPNSNGGTPINGYKIERENSCSGAFSTIVANTTNTQTTYSNTGLTANTCYKYKVSAMNKVGTGTASNNATATTPTNPPTPPSPPTNLVATMVSSSQIHLSWTASPSVVNGYKIERESPIGNGFGTIVANTTNSTTYYDNTGLAPSTVYNYRVSALNATGTSTPSNQANAMTNSSGSLDQFGVTMIYSTAPSGNTWFFKQTDSNPTTSGSDPRFDPQGSITKNGDGSWKRTGTSVRMDIFAISKSNWSAKDTPSHNYARNTLRDNGYMDTSADFKNYELTGYVKLNSWTGTGDSFTWYGRGGLHHSNTGFDSPQGCEGSAYKLDVFYTGGNTARFAKESWHVHYDFQSSNKGTSPNILNKWIGIKEIVYSKTGVNFPNKAVMEGWIDANNNNTWTHIVTFTDDGFGSGATHCPAASNDNMPISWGGPSVTIRWDLGNDVDFKNLSVREITPP